MKITWIGHACFLIEAQEARILTDPFGEDVPYGFPKVSADIVTVSHGHFDHNAVDRVLGERAIVEATGEFDVHGVTIRGIPSLHRPEGVDNILYVCSLEGMQIAHLGDLGTELDATQLAALKDVDVLLCPVGGNYTINAAQAAAICGQLPKLRVVTPMHFKTDRISDWPIETVEPFAEMMDNVRRIGSSEARLTRETLPETMEVWILDHA
ncbi:MBL fold metallo-hydrolase [Candidatus Bipolaricaulota bacterium]|nr:MBL fold metallo-hydrolase [Candidatus Bipolaricaulota bacterium]